MNSNFGLSALVLTQLSEVIHHYPEVRGVSIYGSRGRGDFKVGSDIDLAIDAPEMSASTFSKLWNELDDLPIVYPLDVVHLQSLRNPELLREIARDSKSLF